MAAYELGPVEADPFTPKYDLGPVQKSNPFNPPQPSGWANTGTGAAMGLGNLLDAAGQAEMIEQQAPDSVRTKPGEIARSVTNSLTSGNPYVPQTDFGKAWQNIVSNTVTGLPTAMVGPGGVAGLLARQVANFGGSMGGEAGERMWQDHPVLGRVLGTMVGGSVGAGLLPKGSSPTTAAAPESSGYWTPSALANEFPNSKLAQDVAAKLLGNALQPDQVSKAAPGMIGRGFNWIESQLPEHSRFIPKLLAGEVGVTGLEWLASHLPGFDALLAHPGVAAGISASVPALRGMTTQLPQTAQGVGGALLGPYMNQAYGSMPY